MLAATHNNNHSGCSNQDENLEVGQSGSLPWFSSEDSLGQNEFKYETDVSVEDDTQNENDRVVSLSADCMCSVSSSSLTPTRTPLHQHNHGPPVHNSYRHPKPSTKSSPITSPGGAGGILRAMILLRSTKKRRTSKRGSMSSRRTSISSNDFTISFDDDSHDSKSEDEFSVSCQEEMADVVLDLPVIRKKHHHNMKNRNPNFARPLGLPPDFTSSLTSSSPFLSSNNNSSSNPGSNTKPSTPAYGTNGKTILLHYKYPIHPIATNTMLTTTTELATTTMDDKNHASSIHNYTNQHYSNIFKNDNVTPRARDTISKADDKKFNRIHPSVQRTTRR